jgi:hypothetical protein
MNIVLWMVQGILAFAFVTSGRINAFAHAQAYPNMTWVHALPSALVTFIGICELAGAAGVIVRRALLGRHCQSRPALPQPFRGMGALVCAARERVGKEKR